MPSPYGDKLGSLSETTIAASVADTQRTPVPGMSRLSLAPSNADGSPLKHNRSTPATPSRPASSTPESNLLESFADTQSIFGSAVNELGRQIHALETSQLVHPTNPSGTSQGNHSKDPVRGSPGSSRVSRKRDKLPDQAWNGALKVISVCKKTKKDAKKAISKPRAPDQDRTSTATAQNPGARVSTSDVDAGQSGHNLDESPSAKSVANSSK